MDNLNSNFVTVLRGNKPSHKIFDCIDGYVGKTSQHSYKHDSVTHTVSNLEDLFEVIQNSVKDPRKFLIRGRGKFNQQFDVPRKKSVVNPPFYEASTAWLCIDIDGKSTPHDDNSLDAIEWLIHNHLPEEFHSASYILQWSSSAGVAHLGCPVKQGTSAHLFFFLDKGLTESQLIGWFLDNEFVDKAVFRTVQPIFINPFAEYRDAGFTCNIPDEQKISLITKSVKLVAIPPDEILNRVAPHKNYKPRAHSANSSVRLWEEDSQNEILQVLRPYIQRTYTDYITLWSPRETTPGGYFVYRNDLSRVFHSSGDTDKYAQLDEWLKFHFDVDFEIPAKPLWVKMASSIEMDTPPEVVNIHDQFLPRNIIPLNENQVVFMISHKGSGKTEAMIDLVLRCRLKGQKVCLIGHRVRLLESLALRLKLKFYDKLDDYSIKEKYIAVCVNSLPRISNQAAFAAKYDVVILDESEQVFSHFTQDTIAGKPRANIAPLFYNLLNKAKTVVIADADLTELSMTIVGEACPNHDYLAIENTYQNGLGRTIQMYEDYRYMLTDCMENAKAGKSIYYCSNSKKHIEMVSLMFKELGICDYFMIHGGNSGTPEATQLLSALGRKQPIDTPTRLMCLKRHFLWGNPKSEKAQNLAKCMKNS